MTGILDFLVGPLLGTVSRVEGLFLLCTLAALWYSADCAHAAGRLVRVARGLSEELIARSHRQAEAENVRRQVYLFLVGLASAAAPMRPDVAYEPGVALGALVFIGLLVAVQVDSAVGSFRRRRNRLRINAAIREDMASDGPNAVVPRRPGGRRDYDLRPDEKGGP